MRAAKVCVMYPSASGDCLKSLALADLAASVSNLHDAKLSLWFVWTITMCVCYNSIHNCCVLVNRVQCLVNPAREFESLLLNGHRDSGASA